MSLLYNSALRLGLPAFLPYTLWRIITGKESVESTIQKFGFYRIPKPEKGGIWLHAVSVGEVNASVPLALHLKDRIGSIPLIFSASTQTGITIARKHLDNAATVVYFPYDYRFAVNRGFSHFSPSTVVMMETELWPNFIGRSVRVGARSILINGRISDRSFRWYKKIRPLIGETLRKMDLLLMQSDADATKVIELGADQSSVRVSGNIKFDRPLPEPEEKQSIMEHFGIPMGTVVVVFASTHPGEDEIFLQAITKLSKTFKNLFPIIAPRHPVRTPAIATLCAKFGFMPILRSAEKRELGRNPILILDTIGELAHLYGATDLAVIGGSFVRRGGQNPLEAAAWEVPIIFGPHMENFPDIAQILLESGGASVARDLADLMNKMAVWLADSAAMEIVGRAGRAAISKNRGALEMTAQSILGLL